MALVARRLGKSVLLLERGRHPRFAIGESSTPLTNLLLEEFADRYDMPWLRPLSKWGTWQSKCPQLPCGLKRGFSFYFHTLNQTWKPRLDRANELLVAASPTDALADTHWFRPDFDAQFVHEAQTLGVDYVDEIELSAPRGGPGDWELTGRRASVLQHFRAVYLIDASGPRGYLSRAWSLPECPWPDFPNTQALFSHFIEVPRWETGRCGTAERPPFPPDAAALHHVFPGGWAWVLRFNQGVTSAGCAVTDELAADLKLARGAPAWDELLVRYPSLGEQFQGAKSIQKFTHVPRLSYRAEKIVGPGWCLLPGAAGFIDPLLSSGFILNLLGLERLARLWEDGVTPDEMNYGAAVEGDLLVTAALVGALYRTMDDPASFRALTLLYFAAASYSETARRLGRPERAPGFLLRQSPGFSEGFQRCLAWAGRVSAARLRTEVGRVIAPFDIAGLCTPGKRNWYGCDAADLLASPEKLGVSQLEILAMLRRVGFPAVG